MLIQHASRDLSALHDFHRAHLLEFVMPFWLRHAVDPAGGLNTCIQDDGQVVNRDKWLWSQWRAVWVFSTLYTMIEPRKEWLDLAWHIYHFCARHGWDDEAMGWRLRLGHDGGVQLGCDSIYVDAFAIYGALALAKASGAAEPLNLAVQTADHALHRLKTTPADQIPHFPYPIPKGARMHGVPMMFSLILWELGQHLNDDRYRSEAAAMSDDIFAHFYRPRHDLMVERIALDNSDYPAPEGTMVNPGHVIEDAWFQMHTARDRNDKARIRECIRLMKRHTEYGWDDEFGGLLHARDLTGRSDVAWPCPDFKLWWPHTEALYGLLLAYEHSREPWALQWYDRVHEYSFTHYPVPAHGEWRQRLDRQGNPITTVVALPVKDPFHLPRALIYCVDVLGRLTG